jgi:hypothetical protein
MVDEIFLSYARDDRERAKIFAETIEKQGCKVGWDPKMLGGGRIDNVIQEKLDTAKYVIVLWSHYSVRSDWVIDEADTGKNKGILIPVLVDSVSIPLGFRRIHTLDLVNWKGDTTHTDFDLLLDSIAGILGQTPTSKSKIKKPDVMEIKDKEEQEMLGDKRDEEERAPKKIEEVERIEPERLKKKRRDFELKKKDYEIAIAEEEQKK